MSGASRFSGAGAGAMLFWCASLAVGLAAFVALAALAHHATGGGLADASAVLSASFVTAVFPGAIQLRAAAAAATPGGEPAGMPARLVGVITTGLVVVAPLVALALTVPVLSILLLAAQFPVACHVSVQRGTAIGRSDYAHASASMGADAALRLIAGTGLGLAFGANGLAGALLLGTIAAGLIGRHWYPRTAGGPARDVVGPALTVGLLMLLVNLDVLAAPRVLGAEAADAYAVAELPAKGVFFALFAVSWLAVPIAARSLRRLQLLAPIGAVLGAGLLAAAGLAIARPLLPIALGDPAPAGGLLATLTLAMSAAAALATALAMAVARSARIPWLPTLVVAAALGAAVSLTSPDGSELALFVLLAQATALAGTTLALLRTVAAAPAPAARGDAEVPTLSAR